jgi:hypothetical protein
MIIELGLKSQGIADKTIAIELKFQENSEDTENIFRICPEFGE